jgi:hypothetical protein
VQPLASSAVGITSTFSRDYPVVEAVLEREKPDFVQIDYSLDNREAEKTILLLAADIRAGVLIALPYGNGEFGTGFLPPETGAPKGA